MLKTRRVTKAGWVLALGSVLVTGSACSGSGGGGEQDVSSTKLVSSAPAAQGKVDSIVWNLTAGEPDTLFPPDAATLSGGQVVQNLCDGLIQLDPEFNIKPRLADFEQVSPTKLVYTLKDGATFWDGKPVTADDVVYSLERAKKSSVVTVFFANVSTIEATGDNEVTVNFSAPDAKFNAEMANLGGIVYEKAFAESKGKQFGTAEGGLMCSGPFKLDKWTPGDNITMSRNDSYWNTDQAALPAKVKFTFVTDASALTQALKTGEIDGAYEISPSAISSLKSSGAGNLYFGPSTQGVSIAIANAGGATADPKLRDAMQTLLDRDAIAKAVYKGAAIPEYTSVTPRTWPNDQKDTYEAAYKEFESARAFDVDKATKLVKESSYKGEELSMAIPAGDPAMNQLAQLIQAQAKKAGIAIKIETLGALEFSQVGYDATKRQDYDLLLQTSFNAITDPLEPATFNFLPESPYNYTELDNPEITRLLQEAVSTVDDAKRADLIIEGQKLWEKESTQIGIVQTNTVTFLNKRLAGAVTSFAYWSGPNLATVGSAK